MGSEVVMGVGAPIGLGAAKAGLRSRTPKRVEAAGPDGLLDIEAIAEAYWQLHVQHRSAWTHELDLRLSKEPF